MRFADGSELALGDVASDADVKVIGRDEVAVVVEVSSTERVLVGDTVIATSGKVVLVRCKRIVEEKTAGVGVGTGIG